MNNALKTFQHDHAGARWLAPMLAVLAVVIVGMMMMLIYPHMG